MQEKKPGFTLIEMVIVMFIISLLLVFIVPNLAAQKSHAEEKSNAAFIQSVQAQYDMQSDDEKKTNKPEDLEGDNEAAKTRCQKLGLFINDQGRVVAGNNKK
ncbi:competence type IV pilus major pilin ComGC [Companilactobacillus sp.]|uniref:competence type IV pilus major pilin ComGC n=1 Tax=Companilactobacillus sp. TaxID=2767905 RepID=UPI0025C6E2FD|nr:prepilin-type N-terminal cleavage/methylation domain-containing protein [Companilactobacillus sp.]